MPSHAMNIINLKNGGSPEPPEPPPAYAPVYSGNQYFLNLSIIYNFYLHLHYIMQSSLLQHSNRAVYQASIWARSLQEIQNIPLPEGFGWKNIEGSWKPIWTLLSEVVKAS